MYDEFKVNEKDLPLSSVTPFGVYPLVYLDRDSYVLCANCASECISKGETIRGSIYYEGPIIQCEECSREIESAYGDPEADKDKEGEDKE